MSEYKTQEDEVKRETKHIGLCPFCEKKVSPFVVEENFIRRDVCECPECHKGILVCRTPGCQNYAKTGKYYDDELCPSCLKSLPQNTLRSAATVFSTAATVLGLVESVKALRKK